MSKRGMMDQFFEIKEQHPDTVLFFRMGDFYELFHDDAVVAADVLGLALTSRDKNAEEPIPMAGFPWHGLEEHLRTMLRAGYKVTVAEQEDAVREGAKLLERLSRGFTPPGASMKRASWLPTSNPCSQLLSWVRRRLVLLSSMLPLEKRGPAPTVEAIVFSVFKTTFNDGNPVNWFFLQAMLKMRTWDACFCRWKGR